MTIVSLIVGAIACDPELQDPELQDPEPTLRGLATEFELCGPECWPLLQNCNLGEACLWGGDEWTCQTRTGDVPRAQPCTEATDCSVGLLCVEGSRVADCTADHCCTDLCDLADPNNHCPGESVCTDVFADDDDDAGICLIPVIPTMPPLLCLEELQGISKGD